MTDKKRGGILLIGIIFIGLCYQLIPVFFPISPAVDFVSIIFNAVRVGLLAYILLFERFQAGSPQQSLGQN